MSYPGNHNNVGFVVVCFDFGLFVSFFVCLLSNHKQKAEPMLIPQVYQDLKKKLKIAEQSREAGL